MTSARFALILAAAFPALSLVACVTSVGAGGHGSGTPPEILTAAAESGGFSHRTAFGVRTLKYRKVTLDDGSSTVDVPDVENDKYRLRYRSGTEAIGFYAGFSSGEFGAYETLGAEVGIDGTPHLTSNSAVSAIIDYDATVSVEYGDDEGAVSGIAALYADFFCVEFSGRIGAGVDLHGFQLSTGFAGSVLDGTVEVSSFGSSDEADLSGTNLAGYARAAYVATHAPVFVEIIGFGGDISGVTFNGGVQF